MADKSTASFSADFIDPFAAWEHLPPLEPIIMASIAWIADLSNYGDPGSTCAEYGFSTAQTVSGLVDQARSLIVGLLQAAESVSVSSESVRFNGLIAVRTQTSAAMARSLYRTVAVHLMDMAVSFVGNSLGDAEGQALENALAEFVNWDTLRGDFHAAVFGSADDSGESSTAVRALHMAWPMMVFARSKVVPHDAKLMAQESLNHAEKFMNIAGS